MFSHKVLKNNESSYPPVTIVYGWGKFYGYHLYLRMAGCRASNPEVF